MTLPHIPILRYGVEYDSLSTVEVKDHRTGEPLAIVSQANAGIIRRDAMKIDDAWNKLRSMSIKDLMAITREAGEKFMNESLPLGNRGHTQSPDEYVETLSKTSGLPHTLCRRNMAKVYEVFEKMPTILGSLMRGLSFEAIDEGKGEQAGSPVCFFPTAKSLGCVLPSNSPGVNSLWMPAIPLKTPLFLKPGREEPWTPYRIMQAFLAAGCPKEAFGYYPTDHEGAESILTRSGKALLFGDANTTARYKSNPNINIHGPGYSKVLVGEDMIDNWRDFIDVLVGSVADNGGRSCINASGIIVPRHAAEIADELAKRLAAIKPAVANDPEAKLSSFANPKMAEYMDDAIDSDLEGAEDVTARYREGDRKVNLDGSIFLQPTLVQCPDIEHPLAKREFLFPYASITEVPQAEMVDKIGPTLVVSAITNDPAFIGELMVAEHVDRLNVGTMPTSKVHWDQPHEGNLFEFLYRRRALQYA